MIEKIENIMGIGGTKKDITFLIISAIALLISFLGILNTPFDIAWVAIVLCGVPIIIEAAIGLITEFDIKADVLVSLALIASVCIGEYFAAAEIAFIMQIGSLLEELTVARARAGIENLVKLTPRTARVITDGKERIISADKVKINDVVRVLAGETIPVDGLITKGQTSINQSVMTGESLPVDKTVGDEVSSGTVNQLGAFEMRATRAGEDSSIQRMIRLVKSADADKAKIVRIADKWATWIVVLALIFAVSAWAISGEIIRGVTVLVVFCPCALVLATPTAIMAAIGNATKHRFLVREGDALERLALVSKIAFDKTGTLTYGAMQVTFVRGIDLSDDEIFTLCASAEQLSEHPLGKAVVQCYKKEYSEELLNCEKFDLIIGRGVSAVVNGKRVLAGNKELMLENNVEITNEILGETKLFFDRGSTVIYIALDNRFSGYMVLSDTVREESADMIKKLKYMGVDPVLLTGDNRNSAKYIASKLGIEDVHSNCLPEDKLKYIRQYQSRAQNICMIGDGVNDAPALKLSDVGIAMGGIGSDIAVDAADIALIDDEIKEIPHLIALSKKMMTTIKLNMTFSLCLNFIAIILAVTGILSPVVGALVHNAGSVLVIINSAMLLKWKMKYKDNTNN